MVETPCARSSLVRLKARRPTLSSRLIPQQSQLLSFFNNLSRHCPRSFTSPTTQLTWSFQLHSVQVSHSHQERQQDSANSKILLTENGVFFHQLCSDPIISQDAKSCTQGRIRTTTLEISGAQNTAAIALRIFHKELFSTLDVLSNFRDL